MSGRTASAVIGATGGTSTAPAKKAAARRQRTRKAEGRTGMAYVFLSPWMLGVLLLTLGPTLFSLYLSFTDYDLFHPPHWVGLSNYVHLLSTDPEFRSSLWTTLKFVFLSVPLKLAIALGLAMLLNTKRKGQGFYRSAFYLPSLIGSSVSIAIVWRVLFSTDGVADRGFGLIGLHTGGWIDKPQYATLVLVALSMWQFGAPMVIFLAGLKQIPGELYEAAEVDGAGWWRRFTSVTVPMLSPVIFFNLVLEMINAFQAFNSAFVIGTEAAGPGGPAGATELYSIYLYDLGFSDLRMGYASAMGWMLLIGVGLLTAVLFATSRRWVFYAGEEAK